MNNAQKRREILLIFGALTAWGCGGNAVDLGRGQGGQEWNDAPNAEASQSTPQLLYSGDPVLGFTLDGSTLYVLVEHDVMIELTSCPLDQCASQRTTLYSGPRPANSGLGVVHDLSLVVAGDRIFWTFVDAGLVACAKTGCSELQSVASAWGTSCLAADHDVLYWVDSEKVVQRLQLATNAIEPVRALTELASPEHLAVNGDYLYVIDRYADLPSINRVRKDGTQDSELIVADDGISSVTMAGDSLYYASKILSGRIVGCRPEDCAKTATTLIGAQRWPGEIRIDGNEAFWRTDTRFSYEPTNCTLSSCRLPECAAVETLVADFAVGPVAYSPDHDPSFALGPHSVVWLEARGQEAASRLQRLAR